MKEIVFEKILGEGERKGGYVNLTQKYCIGDYLLPKENMPLIVIIDGKEYNAKVYHKQLWSVELREYFAKLDNFVFTKITYNPKEERVMRIEFDNNISIITDEVEDEDNNVTFKKEETPEYDSKVVDSQEEKYQCIFTLVNCIKNEYEKMSDKQKAFVETVIGASIYYTKNHYGGKSSKEAIKLCKAGKKPTIDHIIPRKFAAKELLNSNFSEEKTVELIREDYSNVYYVTAEENGRMKKYQKTDNFKREEMESNYEQEGIILEEIKEEKLFDKKRKY